MGVAKDQVIAALSPPLPNEIVTHLLTEYHDIKQHVAYSKFRPSELNGGRFAECVIRLIEALTNSGAYTPFGQQLKNNELTAKHAFNDKTLHDSLRFFIPPLALILLGVRNRRDVAHVGGDVSPNFSDSLFISHSADWILTEIVRIYFNCSIDNARKIVESINEVLVPVIDDVDGFIRVQNTALKAPQKVLTILYHKNPTKVRDVDLQRWIRYQNATRFRDEVLRGLDKDELVHYESGLCTILKKGIAHVEKYIPMDMLV